MTASEKRTLFEHPLTYPPVTTTALYREKREMAERKVVVDFLSCHGDYALASGSP